MTGHEGADAIKDEALRQIAEAQGWADAVIASMRDISPYLCQRLQDTRDRLGDAARTVTYQHECIVCAVKAQDYGEASRRHRMLEGAAGEIGKMYLRQRDNMREIGVAK